MKIVIILTLGFFILGLSSCNTIQGVGKDLQSGGRALQDVAQ